MSCCAEAALPQSSTATSVPMMIDERFMGDML
jgi:hypothetical protein